MNNNALAAKAKAMYGRRLTNEDYEELLKRRTVSEITTYLKNNTEYQNVLSDVKENSVHRGQLEILLNRDNFNRRVKLLRYCTGRNSILQREFLREEEIVQVLACLRALLSNDYGNFISDLPLFMNPYMSFDISELLEVKSMKDFKAIIEKTIYHDVILEYLNEEEIDYSKIEHALYVDYYERVLSNINKHFKGAAKNQLSEMLNKFIELKNITKIYRMKKYFNSSTEEIKKSLLPCKCYIRKQTYEQMYDSKDAFNVLKLLEGSIYHFEVEDEEFIYIEKFINEVAFRIARKYLNFAQDPSVVAIAYFLLDDNEVENLINIIEGIRYNIVPNKIEQLLVY